MKERGGPMILTAVSIILLLLLLGYAKMTSGSDYAHIFEGMTPSVVGYCLDNHGSFYPCIKYIKEGGAGFFILAILSADAKEVLYIFRVEGATQTMVWQKGLRL
ncbi:MAG: hypothetical protein UT20_C0044G0004 [Candidatus Levybacteria bacterium GW2011_GWA1_39_11]|nr:MAG: hypothetical protein UT20_C0044G0004 [Candidatus Levybacteria bacterium GW2011_GWA1_39_11]KKT96100.1 MAG: hypothetical protein UW97_C0018G0004 [Parcubacteria group bacterium GW2011_GWA2_45_15]